MTLVKTDAAARTLVPISILLHALLFLWVFKLPGIYYSVGSDTQHVYWPAVRKLLAGRIPYLDPTFFVEYPPPGTVVFLLPALLHPTTLRAYDWLFAVEMLLVDAAAIILVACLARYMALTVTRAVAVYAVLVPALGAVVCQRYDLVPAALVLAALLALMRQRSVTAWLLLLFATLTKLYPVALAPLFLAYDWRRGRRAGAALFGAGLLGSAAAWQALAPDSLHRFLLWEARRGIEIESLAGSLVALLHLAGLPVRVVPPTVYGSWDLSSVLTPALESLSTLLTVGLLAALYLSFARISISGPDVDVDVRRSEAYGAYEGEGRTDRARLLVVYAMLVVLAVLLGSKLLSIQYLLWLLPLAAVAPYRRSTVVLLALTAALLSQYIFPFYWHDLRTLQPTLVIYLVVRNGLLVALCVLLWRARHGPRRAQLGRRVDTVTG